MLSSLNSNFCIDSDRIEIGCAIPNFISSVSNSSLLTYCFKDGVNDGQLDRTDSFETRLDTVLGSSGSGLCSISATVSPLRICLVSPTATLARRVGDRGGRLLGEYSSRLAAGLDSEVAVPVLLSITLVPELSMPNVNPCADGDGVVCVG